MAGSDDTTNGATQPQEQQQKSIFTTAKEAITEANVGAEVDRILSAIGVNSFLKDDAPSISADRKETLSPQSEIATDPQYATELVEGEAKNEIPPATSILAEFVAEATPALLTTALRSQLCECILDFLGVAAGGAVLAPSSEPILKAILAFTESDLPVQGQNSEKGNTVLTLGRGFPKRYAAQLNAIFGHSLDFDDTHADSSLHAGVTAIPTVLAEAETYPDVSSDQILLAILLSYEITARIGIALSSASYSRGFHMTATAGIFGAISAICSLRSLPKETVENAWGFAGSRAAGSMQYLSNGSYNKRLHPGFVVHDAFLCVALAQAGVLGADKIIEGDLGFLHAYTDRQRADVDWRRMTSGLGTRWEFANNAVKPFSGCRMTHGFIELGDSLGKKFRAGTWSDHGVVGVKKLRCSMQPSNVPVVGARTPNKLHPKNMVDAQFSVYFQIANAFVHGMSHDIAGYYRLDDPMIHELSDKIEVVPDATLKGLNARVECIFEDENGEVAEVVRREILDPLGERSHPFERSGVESKFLGMMTPIYGEDISRQLLTRITSMSEGGKITVKELLELVAWPVKRQ